MARRCVGCSRQWIGGGRTTVCPTCWRRVPLELRQERFQATRGVRPFNAGDAAHREVLKRIETWLRANPKPSRGEEPPPWRRHQQV